ncbi:MAG: hypothetical protein JST54_14510 [Deltaproteobacteria bacterium]|nr:hypothetical protein [Deltaproteobacteria bacterium]
MSDEPKQRRSRAEKSLEAIEGDDEFSVSSLKPGEKNRVELKPRLDEAPLPKNTPEPSKERNLFIRLFARIFR